MKYRGLAIPLGLMLVTGVLAADLPSVFSRSYLGKTLPEIIADGTWLNAEGGVTLESLRGRPVLVTHTTLR